MSTGPVETAATKYICARCRLPIENGQVINWTNGRVYHNSCAQGVSSDEELIRRIVREELKRMVNSL